MNTTAFDTLFIAVNSLIAQLVVLLPKLIVALLIWYIGRYLLTFTSKIIKKIDLKYSTFDDKAVESISVILNGVGTVILLLIILDYLGIGSSVVTAIAQGITFAIAIAVGLAFGKALEPDAKEVVTTVKRFLHHEYSPKEEINIESEDEE